MLQAECHALVFSSTCAIYGEPKSIPIIETTPAHPVNPYGASKAIVEKILADYGHAYLLRWIALRYFNASGADPDAEIGELRNPETHLIPRAMMAIQGHLNDFAVFGTDYDTPDGTPIRDYIHVCDLADAHILAVQRLLAGGASGAFNLGTGQGYSVRQILKAIKATTGVDIKVRPAPRRPGDPPVLVADATFAQTELGFTPQNSDLKRIIQTAWRWHSRVHPKRPTQEPAQAASP